MSSDRPNLKAFLSTQVSPSQNTGVVTSRNRRMAGYENQLRVRRQFGIPLLVPALFTSGAREDAGVKCGCCGPE